MALPLGTSGYNLLFQETRHSARKRKIPFDLTILEFKALAIKKCFYCGSIPRATIRKSNKLMPPANGIDRLDSSRGYVPGNCVPSCTTCNRMKTNLPLEAFLESIRGIYERFKTYYQVQKDTADKRGAVANKIKDGPKR